MWQCVGALEGGTVGGLAVVPGASGGQVRLLAVTPAGVFGAMYPDHGEPEAGWRLLCAEGGPPLADAVAVSPAVAQDGTLFVASQTGLYRSTDGGASWRLVLTGEVLSVTLSPDFAADRTLFVGTGQDGVIRSDDGGETWDGANAGLLDLTILAVALSPRFGADRTAFVGTASGLYRSRNGGRSWREAQLGLASPAVQVLAVSPRFADDRLVLVGTEAHGLLRSTDGGSRFDEVADLSERGISALAVGADGRTVVAAAGSDVLRSEDGGQSWTAVVEAPGLVLSLALVPAAAGVELVAGLHRHGVARLTADGRWVAVNEGLRAGLLTRLVPSPRFGADRTLYGLSLDEGLLASRDGGAHWERTWPDEAAPTIAALAVADVPEAGPAILAATADGLLRSDDGGATWHGVAPTSAAPLGALTVVPTSGAAAGFVAVVSGRPEGAGAGRVPADAGVSPASAGDGTWTVGQVVVSEDSGRSWRSLGQIAPAEPGHRLEIGALAASPAYQRDRTLFVTGLESRADGSSTFRLWRSTDGGRNWAVWLEEAGTGEPPLATTLLIPASFPQDGTVVVAVGGQVFTPAAGSWERRGGQRRPLWRAADLGPALVSVTALAAPSGDWTGRTVFAATNAGPFVSRDGGRRFAPWADGYAGGGMVSVAVSPAFADDRLVLGVGVGGTIWQRRDER